MIWSRTIRAISKQTLFGGIEMTFSIVGRDPDSEAVGVAIASVFPSVGAVCPYVADGVAISTQSWDAGRSYGIPITETVANHDISLPVMCEALLEERAGAAGTQLHGLELDGDQFLYTGDRCAEWAGHEGGTHYTAAGNMLVGNEVIAEAGRRFEQAEGPLAERLLEALEAGEAVGGDKRGDNLSAALLVNATESSLAHNLRVDDPGDPIEGLWNAYEVAVETESADDDAVIDAWGEGYPESVVEFGIKW